MLKRLCVGAVLAGVLVAPCVAGVPEAKVTTKTDLLSAEQVTKAIAAFSAACPALMDRYSADIVAVTATAFDEYAGHRQAKGWAATVSLDIKISEKPKAIPADWKAGGHTVSYDLGAGEQPGFFATGKEVTQLLCGLKPERGKDVFKAVPEMAVLAPIVIRRGSVFQTLSEGPFRIAWQPQITLEDGRLYIEGYSKTGMQSISFTAHKGQQPNTRADVDWRPANRQDSTNFLRMALRLTLDKEHLTAAHAEVTPALATMAVGQQRKMHFGGHTVELRRRSEVMFTLVMTGQN